MQVNDTAQAWADDVRRDISALEAAAGALDWEAANACALSLNDRLATPPTDAVTLVLTVFLQAQAALARVAGSAARARDEVAQSMIELGRGRKAVAAYG